MIDTYSRFYYGFEVRAGSNANFQLDFKEGVSSAVVANIAVGLYSPTQFAKAVAAAMTQAGTQVYTVSFDRETRTITVSAISSFTLLSLTGINSGFGPWTLMGFSRLSDHTGTSITGASAAGDMYEPQFKLQDWIAAEDQVEAIDATISETTSGEIEVVKFGDKSFISLSIVMATDKPQITGSSIKNNLTGLDDLRRFMRFLITKGPIEFIPDEAHPETFSTLKLESTPDSQKGTGFRIKELYAKSLPHYYETGVLKFRVVES